MAKTLKELEDDALGLAPLERASLVGTLIASLDQLTDDEYDVVWDTELRRRFQSYEDGTATLIDGDEVLAMIESRYPR